MFIGPCIIAIVEDWKTNLMSLAILFHFLCAQHVSDINISIIRSLRLCCWITTSVVLFFMSETCWAHTKWNNIASDIKLAFHSSAIRKRPCEMIRNMLRFYGEELLASPPTPKLEYHNLSAVRASSFNTFAATLQTGNLRTLGVTL
jgi:hypothetical protein